MNEKKKMLKSISSAAEARKVTAEWAYPNCGTTTYYYWLVVRGC